VSKIKVVHYINQFFGQTGGEDKADTPPFSVEGCLGPGVLLQTILGDRAKVVGTVVCGDNYFWENQEQAKTEVLDLLAGFSPDLVIAGPAFNAGRYGPACGAVCEMAQEKLGIPALTGLYKENPGLELYRKKILITRAGSSAVSMKEDMKRLAELALKVYAKEPLGGPDEEGYYAHGVRKNRFSDRIAAVRGVDMLCDKLAGRPFATEIRLPDFDIVKPASPVKNLSEAVIALVTDGGIVPKGNPDRIKSATGNTYGKYSIAKMEKLTPEEFECIHAGLDNTYGSEDPNRFLPVDAMRVLEKEKLFGRLFDYIYTTAGCTVELSNAKKMGESIAADLHSQNISAVILTSG